MPFDGLLDDNEDIRDVLEYISESLTGSTLTTRDETDVRAEVDRTKPMRDSSVREALAHTVRQAEREKITFRHPTNGNYYTVEVVGRDAMGNPEVMTQKGPKKISKEWIVASPDELYGEPLK
jgi:hypothetical protein